MELTEEGEKLITEIKGPVVTQREVRGYEGARRATNNAGEIIAMIEALRWVQSWVKERREMRKVAKQRLKVLIRYDSKLARYVTVGRWTPKKSKKSSLSEELVERVRNEFQEAKESAEI